MKETNHSHDQAGSGRSRVGAAPRASVHRLTSVLPAPLAVLAGALVLGAFMAGCGGSPDESLPPSYVRVSIDKSEPKRLLSYYFGGYVSPEPADPFEAGLTAEIDGRLYVDRDALRRDAPAAADHLVDADGDGRIDWDELEAFVDRTYYAARSLPPSLDELLSEVGFRSDDPGWFDVRVDGVMTSATREIYVREEAIRAALREYAPDDRRLIYPVGTTFIGRHLLEGDTVETTVMRKREDGFWDFAVYGRDGTLASGTATPPRELKSPIQCVGCHFGDKLFEPEESFPVSAAPGPHGPRVLHVPEVMRDAEVVRFFDEHRRRSDTVLGLYTTLFVSKLRAERRSGRLSEADAALLDALDL